MKFSTLLTAFALSSTALGAYVPRGADLPAPPGKLPTTSAVAGKSLAVYMQTPPAGQTRPTALPFVPKSGFVDSFGYTMTNASFPKPPGEPHHPYSGTYTVTTTLSGGFGWSPNGWPSHSGSPFPAPTQTDTLVLACPSSESLSITVDAGILYDADGKIGYISSDNKINFSESVPVRDVQFAAGWSVSQEGYLALGNQTVFHECTSGNGFELFTSPIGDACVEAVLVTVEISCS